MLTFTYKLKTFGKGSAGKRDRENNFPRFRGGQGQPGGPSM
jgi:hypothetical protein